MVKSTPEEKAAQKIEELKTKLLAMNPTQRDIQLDTITRVIEGSGTVVDIKLPKQAQKKTSAQRLIKQTQINN